MMTAFLSLSLLASAWGALLLLRRLQSDRTRVPRIIQIGAPLLLSALGSLLLSYSRELLPAVLLASLSLIAGLPARPVNLILGAAYFVVLNGAVLLARGDAQLLGDGVLLVCAALLAVSVNLNHFRRLTLVRKRLNQVIASLRRKLHQSESIADLSSSSERRRLRQELHDGTSQVMAAAKLELRLLRQNWQPGAELDARLARVERLVNELMDASREVVENLEPRALEERGLGGALRGLCERFEELSGGRCSFNFKVDEAEIPSNTANAIYRIVQESLTNSYKHSGASRAWVAVMLHENLVVEVGDDGEWGVAPATSGRGLGLSGMTQRAADLGGKLTVGRGASGGTLVRAELPRGATTLLRSVSNHLSTSDSGQSYAGS